MKAPNGTPIIGIVGWKKSGKTTLAVRLIETFTRRGFKVASIKHAHHQFHIDEGHTDSARHRIAGAAQVAIVSKARWAIVTELKDKPEPDFMDVIEALQPADVIVVEGYKSAAIPKIEARRLTSHTRTPISDADPNVIAIAADHDVANANGRPVFTLDDIEEIANFIDKSIGPLGAQATDNSKESSRDDILANNDSSKR